MKSIILKSLVVVLLVQTSVSAWGFESSKSGSVAHATKSFQYIPTELNTKGVRETAVGLVADSSAIPIAVQVASYIGTTASTGTSIATLSGAAATSATLASVGSTVVGTALSGAAAALGVVVSPAVIGGTIVTGVAVGVAYGVNNLIDMW